MYKCPDCRKEIGFMGDMTGRATTYRCPYSKRLQRPQEPIDRPKVKVKPFRDD